MGLCIERSVLLNGTTEELIALLGGDPLNWLDGLAPPEQVSVNGGSLNLKWSYEPEAALDLKPDSGGTRAVLHVEVQTNDPQGAELVRRLTERWDARLGALAGAAGIIPSRAIGGSRLLGCDVQTAWTMVSRGEEIARWINACETWDCRVGGAWKMLAPGAPPGSGWFTAVEPPRELAFTWTWFETELAPTHCRFSLRPVADGTLLEVLHHGWGFGPKWDHELDDCRNGWNTCLSSLSALLRQARRDTQ